MSFDVDIDFADRHKALAALGAVPAMIARDGKKVAHPSGVYLQNAPVDPFTKLCSLDYKDADQLGYFKIDFLNQSVYSEVRDEAHLGELLNSEPEWELLEEEFFVNQLPHVHGHFSIVETIKPKSIDDLAVILALIRPGKRHLIGRDRSEIDREVWVQDSDSYTFKRAHAISYSALVVVKMNLLTAKLLADDGDAIVWT